MTTSQHFIGGEWIDGTADLPVINTSDGQAFRTIARGGAKEIDLEVFINSYGAGGDIELPFGSTKESAMAGKRLRGALRFRIDEDDRIKHGV